MACTTGWSAEITLTGVINMNNANNKITRAVNLFFIITFMWQKWIEKKISLLEI